jgi:hypothetical protein
MPTALLLLLLLPWFMTCCHRSCAAAHPLKVRQQLHHAWRPVTLQASQRLINARRLLRSSNSNTAGQDNRVWV